MNRRQQAMAQGWRSGLEENVAASLKARGAVFTYEELVLKWESPAQMHKYTPDFVVTTLTGKEIVIETKGYWTAADRKKMALIVAQHEELDIRIVFQNPNNRLSKVSKTTYAAWCEAKLGIPWAARDVPTEWLLE